MWCHQKNKKTWAVQKATDWNFGFPPFWIFPMEDLTNLKNKPSSLTWMAAVKKNKPDWRLFICDGRQWLAPPASLEWSLTQPYVFPACTADWQCIFHVFIHWHCGSSYQNLQILQRLFFLFCHVINDLALSEAGLVVLFCAVATHLVRFVSKSIFPHGKCTGLTAQSCFLWLSSALSLSWFLVK